MKKIGGKFTIKSVSAVFLLSAFSTLHRLPEAEARQAVHAFCNWIKEEVRADESLASVA